MKKQDPDVLLSNLESSITDRVEALIVLEHLLNTADKLARRVMDADETNTFCLHVESALCVLDDMD